MCRHQLLSKQYKVKCHCVVVLNWVVLNKRRKMSNLNNRIFSYGLETRRPRWLPVLLGSGEFSAPGMQAAVLCLAERLITVSWLHPLRAMTSFMGGSLLGEYVTTHWSQLGLSHCPFRFCTDYFSINLTTASNINSLTQKAGVFILFRG